MNHFFAYLTVFFCLTCIGVKNQVDLGHAKTSTTQVWDSNDFDPDSDEKFELLLIPIIHNFIFLPTTNYVSVHIIPIFFSSTILREFSSDVSSRGPPHA